MTYRDPRTYRIIAPPKEDTTPRTPRASRDADPETPPECRVGDTDETRIALTLWNNAAEVARRARGES